MQIRLSLNHQARQREGAISRGLEAEISALEKAWLETEHRACRTRKRRSDALGPGSRGPHQKRAALAAHLSEANIEQLTNGLVSAGAELCMGSDSDMEDKAAASGDIACEQGLEL